MKTDTNKMVLEKERQILSAEESDFYLLMSEINTEKDTDDTDMGQIVNNGELLLRIITEQAGSKRTWQIIAACSIIFVTTISFICLSLYMQHENSIERFSQAQTDIQRANDDFIKVGQKAENLENQLNSSKTDLELAQSKLANSNSEVESLKSQLTDTDQRLKALQSRNAEAVKRLNERLQKLSE